MSESQTPERYGVAELKRLMQYLRTPELGCPWDLKQSFDTVAPMTVEETYEVIDAIENRDYSQLKEELGDLFFHIIFYSQLAAEQQLFDFEELVDSVTRKLIARHPHVFPSGRLQLREPGAVYDEDGIKHRWEEIKRKEREAKGMRSLLDDVPQALPGLLRAEKMQKRVASVGFDWDDVEQVMAKIQEELAELSAAIDAKESEEVQSEFGDVLFTLVNLARHLGLDSETSLRGANRKFEARFRFMEKEAGRRNLNLDNLSEDELEQLWQDAKQIHPQN